MPLLECIDSYSKVFNSLSLLVSITVTVIYDYETFYGIVFYAILRLFHYFTLLYSEIVKT